MAIRILILEDDPNITRTLAEMFASNSDFQLLGAYSTGADFFRDVHKAADVLLLDFELPDQNALSVLRRLKSSEALRDMKVLIFTAFEDETRLIHAMEAGANGFLLKDTSPELLLAEIRSVHLGGAPITARMARALLGHFAPPSTMADGLLTQQERRVLQLLSMGLTYAEAAHKLGISINTLKNYTENTYRKLEVRSKSGAIEKGRARTDFLRKNAPRQINPKDQFCANVPPYALQFDCAVPNAHAEVSKRNAAVVPNALVAYPRFVM